MGSSNMTQSEVGKKGTDNHEPVLSSQTDTDSPRFNELLDQIKDEKSNHTSDSDSDTDSSRFENLLARINEEKSDHNDGHTDSQSFR